MSKFKYTVEPGSSKNAWKVLENGDLIAVCQNETNAVTMAGILNEHDTLKAENERLKANQEADEKIMAYINKVADHYGSLKAKAELLIKMLPVYEKLLSDHGAYHSYIPEVDFEARAYDILSRAKELTK